MTNTNLQVFQIEYLKNHVSQKWLPRRNTNIGEIVLIENSKHAWCDVHSRWETFSLDKQDNIYFACGRKLLCPISFDGEKKTYKRIVHS